MTIRKGFPAKLAGVGADADDLRYDLAGLVVQDSSGAPRSGLFPPVPSTLLGSTATMNVLVKPFQGVAVRDGGVILLANDGNLNVLIGAAPASNSRLDVIYAKQNDTSSTVTVPDAVNTPVLGVLAGVASATPVRNPAGLPAGALELGTVLVPSTATSTSSSGVVITLTAQYTATNGGILYVRSQAESDATTWALGQLLYRTDLGRIDQNLPAATSPTVAAGVFPVGGRVPISMVGMSAAQNTGAGAFTTLTWDLDIEDRRGMHAAGSSSIVVQVAGRYRVSVTLASGAATTGLFGVRLLVNGTAVPGAQETSVTSAGASGAIAVSFPPMSLSVGDTIQVQDIDTAAHGITVAASRFVVEYVGAS